MRSTRFMAFALGIFLFSSCGENKEKSTTDTTSTDTSTTTNTEAPASAIVSTPQHMLIVKHRISNYEKWIPSFEAHDSLREANGMHKHVIGRKVGDSNMLFVSVKADDMDKAIAFSKDPNLKQAMQKSGITGTPEMSLVTIVWQDTQRISSNIRSLTTFSVKDWDAWQTGFLEGKQERIDNGIVDRAYGYDAASNNKVSLVTAITDSAKASAYWKSDMLKQRRAQGGVIGEPNRFLFYITKRY